MSFAIFMAIFLTVALIVGFVTEWEKKKSYPVLMIPDVAVTCECDSCVEARKKGRPCYEDLYIMVSEPARYGKSKSKEVHIEIWGKRTSVDAHGGFRFLYLKEEGIQKLIDRLEYVKKKMR